VTECTKCGKDITNMETDHKMRGCRQEGEPMGCRSTAPPEGMFTEYDYSRALDVLDACTRTNGMLADELRAAVLHAMPVELKFGMTWNKWSYRGVK
jgi:hypothetical protein